MVSFGKLRDSAKSTIIKNAPRVDSRTIDTLLGAGQDVIRAVEEAGGNAQDYLNTVFFGGETGGGGGQITTPSNQKIFTSDTGPAKVASNAGSFANKTGNFAPGPIRQGKDILVNMTPGAPKAPGVLGASGPIQEPDQRTLERANLLPTDRVNPFADPGEFRLSEFQAPQGLLDEFEMMRQRIRERTGAQAEGAQRQLDRDFARLGGLQGGAQFKIRQQAQEAVERAGGEQLRDVNIMQTQALEQARQQQADRDLKIFGVKQAAFQAGELATLDANLRASIANQSTITQENIARFNRDLQSRGMDLQEALADWGIKFDQQQAKLNMLASYSNFLAPLKEAGFDNNNIAMLLKNILGGDVGNFDQIAEDIVDIGEENARARAAAAPVPSFRPPAIGTRDRGGR